VQRSANWHVRWMAAMRRQIILVVATLLALCAGILPLVAASNLSHQRAIEAERTHLAEYARWTLKRAIFTLSQAEDTLKELERDRWNGCSPAHIMQMRQIAIDNRSVEEIGYYRNGRLACTSWGKVLTLVQQKAPSQQLPGGFGLDIGIKPAISQAGTVMVLSRGDHNALIKAERMVDVISATEMSLGIATARGSPIAISGRADPHLVRLLAHRALTGMDDRHIFASTRGFGLIAFAISDRMIVQARVDRERWLFVPIGLVVSFILISVIVWVSRQRLSPQKELEAAIRRRAFVPHYQPVIELATGLCVGAEALIRWRRPRADRLPPDLIIPLAEKSGLMPQLTDLMINHVAVDLAINICPSDMESGRFLSVLGAALQRKGIAPTHIWLEATERGFMKAEAARKTIEQARAAGHRISIDDFGTGYSSLSLLESLPIDTLKIDKSFVDTIGKGAATSVVTPHIIEMAHGLRLSIVAEGVETAEQEAYLRAAGVEFAQGWLYSKALPADEFISYCRQLNTARPSNFLKAVA